MNTQTQASLKPFTIYLAELLNIHPLTATFNVNYLRDFIYWYERVYNSPFSHTTINHLVLQKYSIHLKSQMLYYGDWNILYLCLIIIGLYLKWLAETRLEQIDDIDWDPYHQWFDKVPMVLFHPRYLTDDEQSALNNSIQNELQLSRRSPSQRVIHRRNASIILIMLNSGLTITQMLRLRWEDFSIARHTMHIYREDERDDYDYHVQLNDVAYKALRDWLTAWTGVDINAPIWITRARPSGQKTSIHTMRRIIHRIGEDAGIDNLTSNILRDTFATNCINQGMTIRDISDALGLNPQYIRLTYNNIDTATLQDCVATVPKL